MIRSVNLSVVQQHGTAVRAVLIALIGYFTLAASTIALTSDGRNHATVWPADAVILALLLGAPRRHWPLILAAGWMANLLANGVIRGWSTGLILYGGINMAQTWLAATLLQRSGSANNLLEDTKAAFHFILCAGLIAPTLGAAAGSLVSTALYGQPFDESFLRWFASNALGMLIVAPFLKALFDGRYARQFAEKSPSGRWAMIALLALHATTTALVFSQSGFPLLFLPLSTLLLLSFHCGRLGAKVGVIVVAIVAAIAAYRGGGSLILVDQTPFLQAVFLQAYLAVILCTALPVAAAVASRTEALSKLAERDEAIRLSMGNSSNAILSFDSDGRCRWAAGRVEKYLGLGASELIGRQMGDIALEPDLTLLSLLKDVSGPVDEERSLEFTPPHLPGLVLEASLGTWQQESGHGAVVTIRDVSSRKARESAFRAMAETDDLTGVLNRKGFRARLADAVDDAALPLSLALIDVDNFKSVNDRFGHSVGDSFLAEVAARLAGGPETRHVVGRLGGDEFAILFALEADEAKAICEAIARDIRSHPLVDDGNVQLMASISCGVAGLKPGMSRVQLLDAADIALYDVKRAGRDGVRVAA